MEKLFKELESYCDSKLEQVRMKMRRPEVGSALSILSDRLKRIDLRSVEQDFIQKATSIFKVVDNPSDETKSRIMSIGKAYIDSYTDIYLRS